MDTAIDITSPVKLRAYLFTNCKQLSTSRVMVNSGIDYIYIYIPGTGRSGIRLLYGNQKERTKPTEWIFCRCKMRREKIKAE